MGSRPPTTADPAPAERADGLATGVHEPGAPTRLVVRGKSMQPAIADGDVLTIERPPATGAIGAGEIVSFRDDHGRVITHRLLGGEESGSRSVLVTQGDGRTEPDAPWPAERLVGRAVSAERPPQALLRRLVALERLAWWEVAERVATRARAWRPLRSLQRRFFSGSLAFREERRTGSSKTWLSVTCTAADERGKAAGWVTVVRQRADAATGKPLWLLFGLQVRLRYRGLGVGRRLLGAATAAVAREGGGRLYAFVRPGNRPSVELFSAMGWRVAEAPAGTVCAPELASSLCFTEDT